MAKDLHVSDAKINLTVTLFLVRPPPPSHQAI